MMFRKRVSEFTSIGIPASELGIMLGFHTTPGSGGREHAPLPTWLEVTKLQTLAAKEVAKELRLRSVWSWGWGVYSAAEDDPDKATAACVYLWTRDRTICNGPKAAGPRFNKSLTQGQLILPRGARCTVLGKPVGSGAIRDLTPVTGDADVAFTSVFARVVASLYRPLKTTQVINAEKAVVLSRFGSYAAYRAALARAHASPLAARGVIADDQRYESWLLAKERGYAEIAICRKDEQPTPGVVPLTDYLPFLAAD